MNLEEQYPMWFGSVTTNNEEPWRQRLKKIQDKIRQDADAAILRVHLDPQRILRHGIATIVFWRDGTKTVVKRHADEPDNEYTAFCAALAVKVFGSNSQIKSVLRHKTETVEPKKKKNATEKREFREGDMVRYALRSPFDMGMSEKYYPPLGTVGRVERVYDDGDVLVHWPHGTTADDGYWYCTGVSLEVVE